MLAALPDVAVDELEQALELGGPRFQQFVVDHGLGPLWHERTGRAEFRDSRLAAEALFLVQQNGLREIDEVLRQAGVDYAVIKGAADRVVLYDNPAIRACFDLDLLVRPADRLAATEALVSADFQAFPKAKNISHELLLKRGEVDIDLHWHLMRTGRLTDEDVDGMLERRRKVGDVWMLSANDEAFLLLTHSALTKYLAGWEMGLHRVADVVALLQKSEYDRDTLVNRLTSNGVTHQPHPGIGQRPVSALLVEPLALDQTAQYLADRASAARTARVGSAHG